MRARIPHLLPRAGLAGPVESFRWSRRAAPAPGRLVFFAFGMALIATGLLFFSAPASAHKARLFKETFGSAAQPTFTAAWGLAVDPAGGDLLVIDGNANTLSRYKPNGEPDPFSALGTNVIDGKLGPGGKPCAEEPSSCDKTPKSTVIEAEGPAEAQVAIAPPGAAAGTAGDIYLTDSGKHLVDVFASSGKYLGSLNKYKEGTEKSFGEACGVAVDSTGAVFVGDFSGKIHRYLPSANPPVNGDNSANFTSVAHPCSLAAGAGPSAGSLFAVDFLTGPETDLDRGKVLKLSATSGALQYKFGAEAIAASVDPSSGHVFAALRSSPLIEYDASGATEATAVLSIAAASGVAVGGGGEKVYLATGNHVGVYGSPVTLPDVLTVAPTAIAPSKATLHATVNPDGQALTECVFEYGVGTEPYEHSVPCAESLAEIGAGAGPVAVHAAVAGLPPNASATVHFRLVAKNANEVKVPGSDLSFLTAHTALTEPATQITATGATLHGEVNPDGGAATECVFEYGVGTEPYEHTEPCAESMAEIGTGEAPVEVHAPIAGLTPNGTVYHFRLAAANGDGVDHGSDLTLTTLSASSAAPLTLKKAGSGAGAVTSSPAGIDCGSACAEETAEFEEGETVTLTESAESGSEFTGWGVLDCESEPELGHKCMVTMSAAKTVHATFNPIPRTLAITKAGTGTGEVKCKFNGGTAGACTSPQPNGTSVEVIATANAGSTFAAYSAGTGSASSCTASPCSFTLEANSTLTATFNLTVKPKFKLTVTKSGTGTGTITSTPAGINCGSGAGCEAEFEEGVEVTLNQAAAAGSEFKEWTGACTGSGTCKVTMSAAKAVGAVFNLIPRTLAITKAGTGTGEVKCKFNGGAAGACTSPVPNGTAVEVLATANPGSTFAAYSAGTGSASACSTSPCSFTIEANSTLTATFNLTAKPKFKLTVTKSGTGQGTVTSTPAAIACGSGAGCEAEFEEGAEVELKETPAAGSEFKEWTGACSGTGTCKVTMSAAKALGAVFNPIPRTLAITKAGTGTGEVKCKFNGGTAGACTSPQPNGTSVEVIATANAGSTFAGYSAGTGSASACSTSPCSFTLEANSTLTATFNVIVKPKFKLTVTKSGTGTGTITSTPAGINCGSGAGCEAEFEEGVEVELKETPAAGSEFKEWTGACTGSGTCKVTMSTAKALGAVFNPIPRTLAITKAGTGTGEVKCKFNGGAAGACTSPVPNGTAVEVLATANPGSTFAAYSAGTGSASACSTSPCSFTIEANSTLTATFNLTVKPKFKLTVTKSGTGQGTVTSTPAAIACGSGAGCEAEFEEGAEVELKETPAAGSEFKEWTGACSGTGTCKVTMSAAKAIGAVFNPIPRTLAITKAGTGTGEVKCKFNGSSAGACTSPQPNGTAVEVLATANPGSTFAGYSSGTGSAAGCSTSPCSFTLEANSSLTATFNLAAKPKFKLTVSKSGTGQGTVTSTPAAIACGSGAGCEAEFEEGAEVTLNQAASAGSEFKEWTGACSGSGTCKVTMSAAKAVGAVFTLIPRTLSITKAGTGTGEVKCKVGAGSAEPCAASYPNGTALKVEASANAGSTFAGFSAGTGSASACSTSPCSFTLEANSALTATFNTAVKPKFKLTVSKSGTGTGAVTSTPAGINCGSGAGCEHEFEEGAEVTLSQSAASGSEFKEWSGACTGSGACKVTMSAAKSVGAKFNLIPKPKFKLTVSKTGGGTGTITSSPSGITCGSGTGCEHEYDEGTHVVLTETPGSGSEFGSWQTLQCDESTATTCEITINGNEAVAASFVPKAKPKFKLTVSKTGTGSGTVTSSPAGINCGSGTACEHEYEEGTEVTLSQAAASGSEFKEWTGACTGSGACKVTMSAAKAVSAKFEAKPAHEYTLTIELTGSGSGLVNCDGGACAATYKEGTKVTLSATALPGSVFAGWSGGGCSGTAPCKVTMSADTTILAKFQANHFPPPPPFERGTAIASGIAQVQNESALLRLLCPGASRCTGTLELFANLQSPPHGRRHFHRDSPKKLAHSSACAAGERQTERGKDAGGRPMPGALPASEDAAPRSVSRRQTCAWGFESASKATLIGTASFDLAPRSQGTVSVKITSPRALRLLGRGEDLSAQLVGTSLQSRTIRLIAARHRRSGGH